jgi:hypothetical protein
VVDGFFLCPDFSLTHFMMQRRGGPRGNVSVSRDQIELLPIEAGEFMLPMAGRDLALWLAGRDDFAISPNESVLAFLYYFRLARACVGCWIDQTAPLLTHRDVPVIDLHAIMDVATSIAPKSKTAWGIVQEWDAIAEQVRLQRVAIDHATSLPISSSELRTRIEVLSKRAGVVAPSMSKIRRIVGSWFRAQIRDQFGAILPPVANLPALLQDLTTASRELRPQLLAEIDIVVNRATETAETLPPVVAT